MLAFWEQLKKPVISVVKGIGEWFKKPVEKAVFNIKESIKPIEMKPHEPTILAGLPSKKPFTLEEIFKPVVEKVNPALEKIFKPEKKEWELKFPTGLPLPIERKIMPLFEKATAKSPLLQTLPERFEQYVGPFVRKMWPSRIPLAIAEKVVGKPLAITYNELAEKHPVSTTISGLMGDIYNLALVYALTGGIEPKIAAKIPGVAKLWFPTLTRYAPKAIQLGTVWGLRGALDESISQFEKGAFRPAKIATEAGKEFLFGSLLAGPLVYKSVPVQILGMGTVRSGWTALGSYLEDGTLDFNDALNIGSNFILGMALGALGVKGRVTRIQQQELYNLSHGKLVAKVGEKTALMLEQANLATQLGKMYPGKTAAEIMKMVKLLPKNYPIYTLKLPTAIYQQIEKQIPANLKEIKVLPETQQIAITKSVMKVAKELVDRGVPIWQALLKGLENIGFPKIEIPIGLTIKEVGKPAKVKPEIPKELEPLAKEVTKYESIEKMLPRAIKTEDIVESHIFGSSIVAGGKYKDIDIALFLKKGHPIFKKYKSDFLPAEFKKGKIEYTLIEDAEYNYDLFFNEFARYSKETGGKIRGRAPTIEVNIQEFYNQAVKGVKEVKPEVLAGKTFYHGTSGISAKAIIEKGIEVSKAQIGTAVFGEGIYLTPNYREAEYWSKWGERKNPQVLKYSLSPEAKIKIIKYDDAMTLWNKIGLAIQREGKGGIGVTERIKEQFTKYFTDQGYDGILVENKFSKELYDNFENWIEKTGGEQLVIYNIDILKVEVKPVAKRIVKYELPPQYEPRLGKPTWKHGQMLWRTMRNMYGETNKFGTDITQNRGMVSWIIDRLEGGTKKLAPLMKRYEGQRMSQKQYKKLYAMFKSRDYDIDGYRHVMANLKGIEPTVTEVAPPKTMAEVLPAEKIMAEELLKLPPAVKGRRYVRGELIIPGDDFVMKEYPETMLSPRTYLEREKIRAEMESKRMAKIERAEEIRIKPMAELTREEIRKTKSREISAKIRKIEIKNLPLEYKTQVGEILKDFDLKFRTGKTLSKRAALRNYVEMLRVEGLPVEVPEEIIDASERTPLNDMTPEQLESLYEEVSRLVHIGRLKNKLIKIQADRNVDNLTKELADYLLKGIPPKEPPVITAEAMMEGWRQRKGEQIKGFVNRTDRIERILLRLDDYVEGGKIQTVFWKPIEEATNNKIRGIMNVSDSFRDLVKKNKIDLGKILSEKQQFAPDVILTPTEKIGVYLSSQNPDNLMHLKYGNKFDDNLIERVVKSLTPGEKKIADFLQDYFQKEGPAISKTRTLIEGKSLGIVKNYFPIRLQWKAEPVMNFEQELSKEEARRFITKWASSRITKSFLRERTHKAMQAVDLDALSIFLNHLGAVEHYKAFAPVVRDLQLILNRPEFRKAFESRSGRSGYRVMNTWLKQVAETNPLRPLSSGDASVRSLRVNATSAVLGFNLTTALKQFASWFNGMAEVGEIPVIKGLFTLIRHPKAVRQEIKKFAPQIYRRSFEREIAEAKLMKSLEKRLVEKLSTREVLMFLTMTADKITVSSIWKGAFDNYLKKYPGQMEKAGEYATRAIRRTQPFFSAKDLPEYWRSGEFMKALTMFTNQLNQNWNYYRHDMWGKYTRDIIPFWQLVRKTIEAFILPALIIGWASRSKPAKNIKEFVKDLTAQCLAIIPILGSWMASGYKGFKGGSVITTAMLQSLSDVSYRIGKEQWDKSLLTFPELAGYVLGLPVIQSKRIIETIIDMAKGKTDDWLRFIWGRYTREKVEKEEKKKPIKIEPIGGKTMGDIFKSEKRILETPILGK